MGNDIVQANYEELDEIASQFRYQAEINAELHSRLQHALQPLQQGDWIGLGADAFFDEMTGEVFPAMQRLTDALEHAHAVTLEIENIIQMAEEEAAAPFQNGGGGGAGQPSLPDVVETPPGTFDNRRAPYTVGPPQEITGHPFRSGAADALRYDVQIGGQTIPVFVPKTHDPAQGQIHSIDEIAKGLAALPETSRTLVNQVNMNPGQNPDDAFWAQEYNTPNFRSYMTAGSDGVVDIYSMNSKESQDYLDGTLIHETGHIWSQQNWGPETDARWNDWKDAMTRDGAVISEYAKSSLGEDFSETLLQYHQVKGTPQEAEFRRTMPNRSRIIDEIVAGRR